jgi:DNA-binding transcriptional LysR family regulator
MNLRQLEILRAVMRRRTTTGAAHELGMSQPAVSNAIKHAESQLGYLLFDRLNSRLVPTREAEILFRESEVLFQLYEAFRRKTTDLATGRTGRITVLVTAELSESLMPRVLRRFAERHPDVRVHIDVLSLDGVLDGVETGLGDVGFAMAPLTRPGLDYEQLNEMELYCACPADHAIAQLPFVTPADLRDQRLILAPLTGGIHNMVQAAFNNAAVRLEPQIELRFMNVAARCVEGGLGVALVDSLTAASHYEGVVFLPFLPKLPLQVWSIVVGDRPPSRLAKRFIQHARDELKTLPPPIQAGEAVAAGRPAGPRA